MNRRCLPHRGYVPDTADVNALGRALALIVLIIMAFLGPLPARAEAPLSILMLGDSLTAGYGLAAGDALPARLEAALRARGRADVRVINAGVSGDTTARGRARLGWSLSARPGPDAAIVALGANDGLRGLEPAQMKENLDAILATLRAAGLPVLLVGMRAPRNFGPDYVRDYEAVFDDLARKHNALFYPFLLDGVALDPALNQPDGIHPNEKGVARIVAGLLPMVEQLIGRTRNRKAQL
jgi:acyl-CoA thioesterase-1